MAEKARKMKPSEVGSQTAGDKSRFEASFGFRAGDVCRWDSLLRLLCRPTDPASLGVLRFVFGFLMMVDIWQERGWSHVLEDFWNSQQCRFPLFDFLEPLPLVWMYIVYLGLFIGELGICLGLCYKLSCVLYLCCYWYLFLLDKTTWNNHSYLFGLMGVLFLLTDANRYWSIDGLINKKKRHTHVPLWNYALFRFQIFIVYFLAGLKKLDLDWVTGYSMNKIASHFVFAPFRLLLTEEQVSLYIVHICGLTLDLSIGFLLFFDQTRPIAFTFGASFHLMNSQLFSIGMFPWMMIATMPLFCYPDWPRGLFKNFPAFLHRFLPTETPLQCSPHCVYDKQVVKPEGSTGSASITDKTAPPTRPTKYHKGMLLIVLAYVTEQCLLPYSHSITQGYNHWTQGLYGYSWDMMVHSWSLQHIKVTYINKDTGEEGYLNPQAWSPSARWSSHPDMTKQYGACLQNRLAEYDLNNVEIYFDVWRALNKRFQQRTFDPRVNILEAPWSPFQPTPWVLPLLIDLSDWREKLDEIEKQIHDSDDYTDVVFVADFPGLYLENFVHDDLGNTSVTVLNGEVVVELVDQGRNISLQAGNRLQVPVGEFHNIHTVSATPSCYMYIFVNTTYITYKKTLDKYDHIMNGTFSGSDEEAILIKDEVENGPNKDKYAELQQDKETTEKQKHMSYFVMLTKFINQKYSMLQRSVKYTLGAVRSLATGESFEVFVNATLAAEMNPVPAEDIQS